MKKTLKMLSLALIACVAIVGLAACGATTTKLTLTDVPAAAFRGFNLATGDAVAVTATEKDKLVTVVVGEDVGMVGINLAKFVTETENLLGKDFSFTISGVTGTGYAYEIVSRDSENDVTKHTWKKYGTSDTAKVDAELPAGPKLYIDKTAENPLYEIYLAAGRKTDGQPDAAKKFDATGKEFKVSFKADNGKKFELKVLVKTAA